MSSYHLILDSVRGFEVTFVKMNRLDQFYEMLFDFVHSSLTKTEEQAGDKKSGKPLGQTKIGYLLKFYISLFLQYVTVCYNSQLPEGKIVIVTELARLRQLFTKENMRDFYLTSREKAELECTNQLFDLVQLVLNYSLQFQKDLKVVAKKSERAASKRLSIRTVLSENMLIEEELKVLIEDFYESNKATESFHRSLCLNYVFDILLATNMSHFNDLTFFTKYLQENLIVLFTTACSLHAKSVKVLISNIIQVD